MSHVNLYIIPRVINSRLRCLLHHLKKGEIPADVLQKNLFFAAKVLETAFIDEEQK